MTSARWAFFLLHLLEESVSGINSLGSESAIDDTVFHRHTIIGMYDFADI
jgi:hypothetical protein